MSDQINHECGLALIRLLKPLDFYKKKYIVIGVDKFSPSSKKGLDFFAKCNLSSDTEVNKLFKKIEKKYKSIDIIINCVGHIHNELLVNHNKKFIFHSYKNWKKTIDNNLNNVFIITRNFIKLLNKIKYFSS